MVDRTAEIATLRQKLAALAVAEADKDNVFIQERGRHRWGDSREAEQPAVIACPPARLAVTLEAAKRTGALVAIIDTAPHAEAPALAAARAADKVLIPTRPGTLDLRAIGATVEIVKLAGKQARSAIVMNHAPPTGGQGEGIPDGCSAALP
jgi:hypothetical protein